MREDYLSGDDEHLSSTDKEIEKALRPLSFDDFIITNFNSGTMTTFPKFVYVSAARGIPPQANVIGSAMFIIALAVVILGQIVGRKRAVK